MGSGASRDSSEESSTRITGTSASKSSTGPRSSNSVPRRGSQAAAAGKHEVPVRHPAKAAPVSREPLKHIDPANMSGPSKSRRDDTKLGVGSGENLIPSAKSSSDFDDDAFEEFCGEIDHVLEGHGSVVEASSSQPRKSSVSSSIAPDTDHVLPQLPTATRGQEEAFLERRRPSGPISSQGGSLFQPQQQYRQGYQTGEIQLGYQQKQEVYPHHHQQQQQQHHPPLQQQQPYHYGQHPPHRLDDRPILATGASGPPPPLATKSQDKPPASWKLPEELAHRERVMRDRYEDAWFRNEAAPGENYLSGTSLARGASREGSTMRMRQNSDLVAFQEEERRKSKQRDFSLKEKEGFDVSKFKAANKKTNSHKVDKLLPATYKGYNASLSRQGTLPSLHRGSVSSTVSGSGTPASDGHGLSPSPTLKYNSSEEALLDFIEKEFS